MAETADEPRPGEGSYPRFSEGERRRRRAALAGAMEDRGVEHLIVYGANRFGSAVAWLTGWPVTREALCVFTPGERDVLLVHFYNHVPNAARLASAADVRWAGESTIETAAAELRGRGAVRGRVGVVGPLLHRDGVRLAAELGEPVDLNRDYLRLRRVKSAEEIEWLRIGCRLTDRAVEALGERLRPGLTEHQLGDICERAYVGEGGRTHIHYFGVTSMGEPEVSVPAQWPSARRVAAGDAVSCEISASYWDYTGQVLRTFAVEAEPSPRYEELHAVADAAFEAIAERLRPGTSAAELVAASAVIEEHGYTIRDDLVHGFVGGYLPPVLGSASRRLTAIPDLELEAGMTLVVQPNVITRDETAGVQTGELLLVGERGPERLHAVERGMLRAG
ncbi:MAG: M24 family metallopeptidase [Solirubrobacterales bacterium]|nr:M24 family metallopeptidase [Solirubrobacterales bacterium]